MKRNVKSGVLAAFTFEPSVNDNPAAPLAKKSRRFRVIIFPMYAERISAGSFVAQRE
jgi:hypothetical protein